MLTFSADVAGAEATLSRFLAKETLCPFLCPTALYFGVELISPLIEEPALPNLIASLPVTLEL